MGRVIKTISYIVLLLAVVAVVGVFAKFTDGFTGDFKTFYVSVEGNDVLTSAGGYTVTEETPLEVSVKYVFGALSKDEPKGYTVKIAPNRTDESKNFPFTAGGETFNYYDTSDLTSGFVIEKGETSFRVTPKGGTVTEILSAVYNQSVSDCENFGYSDMFTVIITSYNGEASVKLHFSLAGKVTKIILDKEAIEF